MHPPVEIWQHVFTPRHSAGSVIGARARTQCSPQVQVARDFPRAHWASRIIVPQPLRDHPHGVCPSGRSDNTPVEDGDGWQSLSEHLSVRDTTEQDEDAELMVSTVVPTFALMLAPASETEVTLRPRDSVETMAMSESMSRKLGSRLRPVFYGSTLDNRDRTAILVPGKSRDQYDRVSCSSKPLACPAKALSIGGQALITASTTAMFFRRSLGEYVIDYSLELFSKGRSFLYRVSMTMANEEARRLLERKGCIPIVESRGDPCCLYVTLDGGKFVYATRFPFPVDGSALQLKFSKKNGSVNFTVPLLVGPVENPFSLTRQCTTENGRSSLLLSTWCFPATVPLGALPKLDVNTEWAHQMVQRHITQLLRQVLLKLPQKGFCTRSIYFTLLSIAYEDETWAVSLKLKKQD